MGSGGVASLCSKGLRAAACLSNCLLLRCQLFELGMAHPPGARDVSGARRACRASAPVLPEACFRATGGEAILFGGPAASLLHGADFPPFAGFCSPGEGSLASCGFSACTLKGLMRIATALPHCDEELPLGSPVCASPRCELGLGAQAPDLDSRASSPNVHCYTWVPDCCTHCESRRAGYGQASCCTLVVSAGWLGL